MYEADQYIRLCNAARLGARRPLNAPRPLICSAGKVLTFEGRVVVQHSAEMNQSY